MEVFKDEFSVYGDTSNLCLANLAKVVLICEKVNLVFNYKSVTSWCRRGVVLGHIVSQMGIEVDKAKIYGAIT